METYLYAYISKKFPPWGGLQRPQTSKLLRFAVEAPLRGDARGAIIEMGAKFCLALPEK